jgi:hypothetical protein
MKNCLRIQNLKDVECKKVNVFLGKLFYPNIIDVPVIYTIRGTGDRRGDFFVA